MPPGSSAPSRVVGRYALFDPIAAGGMATVHYGRMVGDAGFTRTVAIKRLHGQFAMDPEFRAMFLDEARVAARIQHPNAVGTLDVVEVDGELLLVMEYVPGEALSRLMRDARSRNEPMPPKVAASIVTGALYGLHGAHEASDEQGQPLGIVHRDVSPHNIMVGKEGVARVLDFGIAKAAGRMQSTREGQVKGKMSYMAPEQIASEPVDRRADVYSAGVVLWEALCGRRLFDGENQAAVMAKVVAGVVELPSHLRPDVPAALDDVIKKALARAPEDRFATARELAHAIEETLGIASPGAVGDWVARFAGDALEQRAQRVKEIETLSSSELEIPPPSVSYASQTSGKADAGADPDDGPTRVESQSIASQPSSTLTQSSNVTLSGVNSLPRSRRGLIVGVVAAVLVTGVVVATTRDVPAPESSQTPAPSTRGERGAGSTTNTADPAPADATAGSSASAAPSPSASPSTSPDPSPEPSESALAPPHVAPPAGPPRGKKPPATDPPPVKPNANCDPPYYLDANGVKRFKVECL